MMVRYVKVCVEALLGDVEALGRVFAVVGEGVCGDWSLVCSICDSIPRNGRVVLVLVAEQ